ncbi:hypothetical protein NDU88_004399 [Pleurodeles waltl]|uniref:Uncharacterized protein n=1 Tax=Pleurodeles waltl TaxID=8319 RepID=A0AAV7QCI3_PLEWA|nr:hypothetical protein NDU88_004399 [Pleurodeles waltl]
MGASVRAGGRRQLSGRGLALCLVSRPRCGGLQPAGSTGPGPCLQFEPPPPVWALGPAVRGRLPPSPEPRVGEGRASYYSSSSWIQFMGHRGAWLGDLHTDLFELKLTEAAEHECHVPASSPPPHGTPLRRHAGCWAEIVLKMTYRAGLLGHQTYEVRSPEWGAVGRGAAGGDVAFMLSCLCQF